MHNKSFRAYFNWIFLIVLFVLTGLAIFQDQDPAQVLHYLQSADPVYIIPAVVCVVLFILGESVVIKQLLHSLGTRISFTHCSLYSFIGFFYSCITPSASGGQPMQVIAMRKDKIPVAVSTVVLVIIAITYKLVLVMVGLAVLLIRPQEIMYYLEPVEGFMHLGLFLNVIVITGLILLVFHPGALRRIAENTIHFLHKIRPFRHPERIMDKLEQMAAQYDGTAQFYRSRPGIIISVFLITVVQRLLLFLVTWFAYRAFGLEGDRLVTIVTLQAMISVAVDMLPLPGGMGISENLFLTIFEPLFGAALVLPGMMICRGISFYTQLLISAVMTAAASFIIREKK